MKHRIWALLPFFVFVVIFAGAGIISRDFYSMPAYVAFLIALFVAFLQNRKLSFDENSIFTETSSRCFSYASATASSVS